MTAVHEEYIEKLEKSISLDEKELLELYMDEALTRLKNSTFITTFELDHRLKMGLFGIMLSYDLSFRIGAHGGWEWVELCEREDTPALNKEQIKARKFNKDGFNKALREFHKYILKGKTDSDDDEEPEESAVLPPYGWLSPSGEFTESPWGTHDESAAEITFDKFGREYDALLNKSADNKHITCRDYLIMKKHYVLIHDPSNLNSPMVSKAERLTKQQKEFLFDYFTKIGNKLQAEIWLNS